MLRKPALLKYRAQLIQALACPGLNVRELGLNRFIDGTHELFSFG